MMNPDSRFIILTYQMDSTITLDNTLPNYQPRIWEKRCKYVFFVKMTFLNHVRFTKRLQYIIVLVFCLTFLHKFKMEFWKDNCWSPLKLLLMWDLDTSKIHIEVWRILFQCVWIISICTEFWKEKWESLSIPLIWHLDVTKHKTKVWRINFQVF